MLQDDWQGRQRGPRWLEQTWTKEAWKPYWEGKKAGKKKNKGRKRAEWWARRRGGALPRTPTTPPGAAAPAAGGEHPQGRHLPPGFIGAASSRDFPHQVYGTNYLVSVLS